jgi:hypothetical protein
VSDSKHAITILEETAKTVDHSPARTAVHCLGFVGTDEAKQALQRVSQTDTKLIYAKGHAAQLLRDLEKQEVKKVGWDLYLAHVLEQLDCYFTIERMGFIPGEKRDSSPFHGRDLTLDPNVKTVEALVKKLRTEMKGIVVIQNAKNPAVIHLVEERLLEIEGYVMDKKVDVTYSGLIDELPGELGKHAPGIGFTRGGAIGEVFGDFKTQVKVDAKDQAVREVLTGCVPLKDYSPVLWDTKTRKKDGQYKTIVRYHGPRRLPPKK